MSLLQTIESDLTTAWGVIEGDAEQAGLAIWDAAKVVFTKYEPQFISDILAGVTAFLSAASADVKSGALADIETAFLNDMSATGSVLLADAQSLGSDLLQALIGLAKVA